MIYLGIDPGKSGAFAFLSDNGFASVYAFDEATFINILRLHTRLKPEEIQLKCMMEKVGAMPGQGVVSMFSFGMNYGWIQGVLTAEGVPYELVTPAKWKKEFGVTADKNTSIEVCKRLFPDVNLKKTERCKKDHDGMAEALLLAEFARRHMR